MRTIILVILNSFISIGLFAQKASQNIISGDFDNDVIKCLYVGFTYQGVGLNNLNKILDANGYGKFPEGITCVSLTKSVQHASKCQAYYGIDFGLENQQVGTDKTLKFNYYRLDAGLGYMVPVNDNFTFLPHIGFAYSVLTLRLYDHLADTTSFNNYVGNQPSDMKRAQAQQFAIDMGVQYQFSKEFFSVVWGIGYIAPFGENLDWTHEAGTFGNAPTGQLATWYALFKIGMPRHLHIKVLNKVYRDI